MNTPSALACEASVMNTHKHLQRPPHQVTQCWSGRLGMEGKHYFDKIPYPAAVRRCTRVTSLSNTRVMRSSGRIGVSFRFAPNKVCGRAMRTTPVRLITVKESDLESMNIATSRAHIRPTVHTIQTAHLERSLPRVQRTLAIRIAELWIARSSYGRTLWMGLTGRRSRGFFEML